jgi:hypothetical protein|nr:MAG TPA: hypothetical protein [Caudoviricetes sp.]
MLLRFENYRQYYQMCSLWASVFESRNIEWIYCPESDKENGIWQGADFYFPEQDTYFVVDQRRPGGGKGRIGCRSMSKKTGKMIVMGNSQGSFKIFEGGFRSRSMRPGCVNVRPVGSISLQTYKGTIHVKFAGDTMEGTI